MSTNDRNTRLDATVEAIVVGVYDSGALYDPHRWWPQSYLPYSPLFAGDFHSKWLDQWRRLPRPSNCATATSMWVLLAMASRSLKAMFPVDERCEIVLALLDDIEAAKAGDIFCRDGAHRVLDSQSAQHLVDSLAFSDATDSEVDRAYARLSATLLAYSEAVFFSANCTVREVHGPYAVKFENEDRQLLVRDYYKLIDTDVEEGTRILPLAAVRACSLYTSDVRFAFSVLNDYTSDIPLPTAAVAHAGSLVLDGADRPLGDVGAVDAVREQLSSVIASVSARTRAMSPMEQSLEVIRRTYYRASPVAAAVGEAWEPSSSFRDELRERLASFSGDMPPAMTRDEFGSLVDPRV